MEHQNAKLAETFQSKVKLKQSPTKLIGMSRTPVKIIKEQIK